MNTPCIKIGKRTVLLDDAHVPIVAAAGPWRRGSRCYVNNQLVTLWRLLHGDKVMVDKAACDDYRSSNATARARYQFTHTDISTALANTQTGPRTSFHAAVKYKTKYAVVTLPISTQIGVRHVTINACYAHLVPTTARYDGNNYLFRAYSPRWRGSGDELITTVSLRSYVAAYAGMDYADTCTSIGDDYRIDPFNSCFVAKVRSFNRYYKTSMGTILHICMMREAHDLGLTWPTPSLSQDYVFPQCAVPRKSALAGKPKHVYVLVDDDVVEHLRDYKWIYNCRTARVFTRWSVALPLSGATGRKTTGLAQYVAELGGTKVYDITIPSRPIRFYEKALIRLDKNPVGSDAWHRAAKAVAHYENLSFDEGSAYVPAYTRKYKVCRTMNSVFVPDFYDGTGVICLDARKDSVHVSNR